MKIVKDKIEIAGLKDFLIEAKKNTYGAGGEEKEIKLDDGGKKFIFEKDGWKYEDKYFGFDPFVGEEIVWQNGKVVWVMNYCGKVLKDTASPKEIYAFLKKALLQPDPLVPLRGPEKFEEGDFKYVNVGGGDLSLFQHVEVILYEGERVYELSCHGGMIK
jgi:hypothetical protein